MRECCIYCYNKRRVGCQNFCEKYKSDFDRVISINHTKNNAERSMISLRKGALNNAKTK